MSETASWVIVNRKTNKPVFETFSHRLTQKINEDNYEIVPILEWLQRLNRRPQIALHQVQLRKNQRAKYPFGN